MRSIINSSVLGATLLALTGCPWDQPAVVGDCVAKSCGDPCNACDGDPDCPLTNTFCQADGMCAAGPALCGAESPCSIEYCPANTYCIVLSSNPPVTDCVPVDACTGVSCALGTHCESGACVVDLAMTPAAP